MLGFQHTILPTADGCHPHITMSARSNKIDRFNAINPLQTDADGGSYDDGGDGEDDDDDDDYDGNTKIDDDASAECSAVLLQLTHFGVRGVVHSLSWSPVAL